MVWVVFALVVLGWLRVVEAEACVRSPISRGGCLT
jgi:hypothetical protein